MASNSVTLECPHCHERIEKDLRGTDFDSPLLCDRCGKFFDLDEAPATLESKIAKAVAKAEKTIKDAKPRIERAIRRVFGEDPE